MSDNPEDEPDGDLGGDTYIWRADGEVDPPPDIWLEDGADPAHVELHVRGEEEIETLFHAMGCARDLEGAEDATEMLTAISSYYLRDLGVPVPGEDHEGGEDPDRLFVCPRCGDTKASKTGVCPDCGGEMNLQ